MRHATSKPVVTPEARGRFGWLDGVVLAAIIAAPVVWSWACSPDPFACTTAVDCVNSASVQGICETGFCAYADSTCPTTHERYSVSAGNGLASTCVPADAGAADAGVDAGAGVTVSSCGACGATEICAATTTPGGACSAASDGGHCADGGDAAAATTAYKCWPIPSACATSMTCGCAYDLCGFCACQAVTDAGVRCQCPSP